MRIVVLHVVLYLLTSIVALFECIKADHGFSIENQSFRNLIGILSEFDKPARRSFLQFCTGSPKLPIGGTRHTRLVSS